MTAVQTKSLELKSDFDLTTTLQASNARSASFRVDTPDILSLVESFALPLPWFPQDSQYHALESPKPS